MPTTPHATTEAIQPQPDSNAIAPAWHMAVVLLLLFSLVALGWFTLGGDRINHAHNRVLIYALTIAIEWLIVAFIAWGARWQGASLTILAGNFSFTLRSIARDLGLAIAYLVIANIVLGILGAILGRITHATPNAHFKSFLPHTGLEIAAWLLLALTAGICEEMIFRGYLQPQFTAFAGNAAAGIVLQGIVFGAAHAYQGSTQCLIIAFYGCMFGSLAYWRKSLIPGMAAHFIQDAVGGLVLSRFMPK